MARDDGLHLLLIDFNRAFKGLKREPIVINDVVKGVTTAESVKILNDITRIHYNGDALDITPTCGCGELSGKFNEGQRCRNPDCPDPEVKTVLNQDFDSYVWFRNPAGRFINPLFWARFNANFTNLKDFDIMRYITDARYDPILPPTSRYNNLRDHIDRVVEERSLAYVTRDIETFKSVFRSVMTEEFIKILYTNKKARVRPTQDMEDLLDLLDMEGTAAMCRYIPYPSKWAMVTEQSGGNTFTDPTMLHAIDAAKMLASAENAVRPLSPEVLNSKLVTIQLKMASFYTSFIGETVSGKHGLARRQLGSTRSPWSARVVIIPHNGAHVYDEVTPPWSWLIAVMRNHIEGVLLKAPYSMTPKEISKYIDYCLCNYDEMMDDILMNFIKQSPIGGIGMAMLRNPTLEFLSNQLLRITDFYRDPHIYAMKISNLIIKAPNADYDGDMTQCKIMLDQYDLDTYSVLVPSNGFISLSRPNSISENVVLHPETISLINNYRASCLKRAKNGE